MQNGLVMQVLMGFATSMQSTVAYTGCCRQSTPHRTHACFLPVQRRFNLAQGSLGMPRDPPRARHALPLHPAERLLPKQLVLDREPVVPVEDVRVHRPQQHVDDVVPPVRRPEPRRAQPLGLGPVVEGHGPAAAHAEAPRRHLAVAHVRVKEAQRRAVRPRRARPEHVDGRHVRGPRRRRVRRRDLALARRLVDHATRDRLGGGVLGGEAQRRHGDHVRRRHDGRHAGLARRGAAVRAVAADDVRDARRAGAVGVGPKSKRRGPVCERRDGDAISASSLCILLVSCSPTAYNICAVGQAPQCMCHTGRSRSCSPP